MGANERPLLMQRHRITAEQYHQMAAAGVLAPDARVELIDGEIIDMAAIGSRHWSTVVRLHRLVQHAVGDQAIVSSQSSFRLSTYSEPEPDLALFKPRDDFYAGALPTADETLLVIEVADSSARYDREIKLPLYARDGVGEVWIIDLDAMLMLMHREPVGDAYAQCVQTAEPGVVGIAALPGVALNLTGLLKAVETGQR